MTRWCQAGNQHVWLRQDNTMRLCCSLASNVDSHTYKLNNTEDFLSIIQSPEYIKKYSVLEHGGYNNDCDVCIDREADPEGTSQRFKLKKYTNTGNKFYLKIDFSNKCNLKCVMCGSDRSTAWLKDEKRMNQLLDHDMRLPEVPYSTMGIDWWTNIPLEWWRDLGTVELSGGEPLYQEDALEFIKFLSEHVPDCHLRIMTNGTLIDTDILNKLSKFKRLNMQISVDAWDDKIYRYARGDHFGIEEVKDNITRILSICRRVFVIDTIHPITYDQSTLAKPIMREWYDKGVYRSQLQYHHQKVYKPEYLDVDRVLPTSIWPTSKPEIDMQIKFYKFITALDKVRKSNVLDLRPEFKDWFAEIEDKM